MGSGSEPTTVALQQPSVATTGSGGGSGVSIFDECLSARDVRAKVSSRWLARWITFSRYRVVGTDSTSIISSHSVARVTAGRPPVSVRHSRRGGAVDPSSQRGPGVQKMQGEGGQSLELSPRLPAPQ